MNVRSIVTIALATAWLFPPSVAAAECEGPEGTSAWAGCVAFKEFERADKQLNATYRKLLGANKMSKPEWKKAKEKLVASQRAWLAFKDKDCEFDQELSGGANKASGLDCQTEMTKERTIYLERVLEQFK